MEFQATHKILIGLFLGLSTFFLIYGYIYSVSPWAFATWIQFALVVLYWLNRKFCKREVGGDHNISIYQPLQGISQGVLGVHKTMYVIQRYIAEQTEQIKRLTILLERQLQMQSAQQRVDFQNEDEEGQENPDSEGGSVEEIAEEGWAKICKTQTEGIKVKGTENGQETERKKSKKRKNGKKNRKGEISEVWNYENESDCEFPNHEKGKDFKVEMYQNLEDFGLRKNETKEDVEAENVLIFWDFEADEIQKEDFKAGTKDKVKIYQKQEGFEVQKNEQTKNQKGSELLQTDQKEPEDHEHLHLPSSNISIHSNSTQATNQAKKKKFKGHWYK